MIVLRLSDLGCRPSGSDEFWEVPEVWHLRLLEYSALVSIVLKLGQVFPTKYRKPAPIAVVATSRRWRDVSVCIPILANACHVASTKMRSRTVVLCGSSRSPSKQGIMHYRSKISSCLGVSWMPTHLENIFEIMSSEPFHLRDVIIKPADCLAKCRNLPETENSES